MQILPALLISGERRLVQQEYQALKRLPKQVYEENMKTIQVNLTNDHAKPRKIARLLASGASFSATSASATVANKSPGALVVEDMNKTAPRGIKYALHSESDDSFEIAITHTVSLVRDAAIAANKSVRARLSRVLGVDHEFKNTEQKPVIMTVNVTYLKIAT